MSEENLFSQDWQDCLRAHYAYVVREQDMNNEHSLVTVLLETGFGQQDIDEMRTALGWVVEPPPSEPEPEAEIALQIEEPAERAPAFSPAPSLPETLATAEIAAPAAAANVAEPEQPPEAKKPARPPAKKAQDAPPEPPKQMSLF